MVVNLLADPVGTPTQDGSRRPRGGVLFRLARRVVTERSSPGRLGWAVGIGILIGTSPFYGLHLLICLSVATLLGLNRAITYLAANISVPWIAPLLIFASLQLGSLALNGEWMAVHIATIQELGGWTIGQTWLVGWLILGSTLGLTAGLLAWALMRAYRQRRPLPPDPAGELLAATAQRYLAVGRFHHGYVKGKFQHDPVYRQLAERVPLPGPIVDIGCGRGQTALVLLAAQSGLESLGLDWDEAKLEVARRAVRPGEAARFERADIAEAQIPAAGCILLIDVLHYNAKEVQDAMLRRAARALKEGGVLFVRDVDMNGTWRARVNGWQERIGCAFGLNRGHTLCFRPASEILELLRGEDLQVRVDASWADLPFANVLIEAHRPPPPRLDS